MTHRCAFVYEGNVARSPVWSLWFCAGPPLPLGWCRPATELSCTSPPPSPVSPALPTWNACGRRPSLKVTQLLLSAKKIKTLPTLPSAADFFCLFVCFKVMQEIVITQWTQSASLVAQNLQRVPMQQQLNWNIPQCQAAWLVSGSKVVPSFQGQFSFSFFFFLKDFKNQTLSFTTCYLLHDQEKNLVEWGQLLYQYCIKCSEFLLVTGCIKSNLCSFI